MGIIASKNGCLDKWADQGVFLLNSILTVEAHKPGSHAKWGWDKFTNQTIKVLNDNKEGLVFILWGSYAQSKAAFIDSTRHEIIRAAHPSPLSAYRGFFGSKPFSSVNRFLLSEGKEEINWSL